MGFKDKIKKNIKEGSGKPPKKPPCPKCHDTGVVSILGHGRNDTVRSARCNCGK